MAITKITPEIAYVGDEILIEGTEPGAGAMRNTVHFNGVQAFPLEWAPDHIRVVIPDGATSGPISVVNDGNVTEVGYVLFGGTSVATARAAAEEKKHEEKLARLDQQKTSQAGAEPGHDEVVSGIPTHNETGAPGVAANTVISDKMAADKAKAEADKTTKKEPEKK